MSKSLYGIIFVSHTFYRRLYFGNIFIEQSAVQWMHSLDDDLTKNVQRKADDKIQAKKIEIFEREKLQKLIFLMDFCFDHHLT